MATTTDNSTFSKWLYSHCFEFVTEMDKNLTVRCTLCAGGRPRELSTAKNSCIDDGAIKSKQRKLDFSRPAVKMFVTKK